MPDGQSARKPSRTVGEIGEKALIRLIQRWLEATNPPPPFGIGDDCAVIPAGRNDLLVTVDPVIRGRHFDDSLAPRLVGEKLLKRNLSDIAAMGGTPSHAVVAISAPPNLPVTWLAHFYRGLAGCAQANRVAIVGGDCTQCEGSFAAYLTLIGRRGKRLLTRDGACDGDVLFVSGKLGGSLLRRHARFTPRLAEGQWLAAQRGVHAMIDLSDGLGKDLPAIISDGLQAEIDTQALPASRDASRAARQDGRQLLDHVLNDGEDFELLFAVARKAAGKLEREWRGRFETPLTRVGHLGKRPHPKAAAVVFRPPLPSTLQVAGYEHFR